MAGIYRPRHPERTVLYRVLFHYFDRFLAEYEDRFEKEYGFLRPVIKEVVERYLDCGNPRCGFARIRCPDYRAERLLIFSCRTHGLSDLLIIEEEDGKIPRRGWAEMIRKVYETDPLLCPECGGQMRIISFLTDYAVVGSVR
jgi:hypothetical protein